MNAVNSLNSVGGIGMGMGMAAQQAQQQQQRRQMQMQQPQQIPKSGLDKYESLL